MNSSMQQDKKNKRTLITILLMPFITIVASGLFFYMAKNDIVLMRGTQNNGALVQPPFLIDELPLLTLNNDPINLKSIPSKWRFLLITDQHCDNTCQETLWETRQIRLALGKFQSKIERVFIHVGGSIDKSLLRDLQKNHQDTHVFLLKNASKLNSLLKQRKITGFSDGRFFVVDPDGYVMMFFDPVTADMVTTEDGRKLMYNYKDVMQDMKHLIKLN